MIKLNPAMRTLWTRRSKGRKRNDSVMLRSYTARMMKRMGRKKRKWIRLERVFTVIKIEGTKFGRLTRSRLLMKRVPAELRQLLNQIHGKRALNTKAG
jgi:hypothetical protein